MPYSSVFMHTLHKERKKERKKERNLVWHDVY